MPYWIEAEIRAFRRRANEAREMARRAVTAEMRDSFLRIARDWEALIKRSEQAQFAPP
jgi:predicted glycosyl hydrolase (DUF1957 family)